MFSLKTTQIFLEGLESGPPESEFLISSSAACDAGDFSASIERVNS